MRRASAAFTLLELSLGILLIGLLIGSVLVGIDLIHAAKLQRVLAQMDAYNKAVEVFRDKYHEFPGDMPDATTFWGAESACPATPYTAAAHVTTCNGDGNGHIGEVYSDGGATSYELYRLWQHLANAGFAEGAYNGMSGPLSTNHSIPYTNVPPGPLENTAFNLFYLFRPAGDTSYWANIYNHVFFFGAATADGLPWGGALTPREALILDGKVDDGRPAYGTVMAFKSATSPGCTTSDTNTASGYNATQPGKVCSLIFITGY